MGFALQLLFTGIGVGSIYALVALGFVLIYRATNVVNFAQGDFAMLGAFAMIVLAVDLGWPYWLSILITLAVLVLFGALFNLGVYYPLRNRSFLPVIIVVVTFHYLFFERTLIGKKMQASSQDKEIASLLGIPVALMIMLTFAYSAVLGGLAGILVAPVLFVSVGMASSIALKAFAASIIGGFGDVPGAIVGGLALGVIETFGAAYISVPYKDGFAFLVLFVFLLFRPQGIFGERIAED